MGVSSFLLAGGKEEGKPKVKPHVLETFWSPPAKRCPHITTTEPPVSIQCNRPEPCEHPQNGRCPKADSGNGLLFALNSGFDLPDLSPFQGKIAGFFVWALSSGRQQHVTHGGCEGLWSLPGTGGSRRRFEHRGSQRLRTMVPNGETNAHAAKSMLFGHHAALIDHGAVDHLYSWYGS